VIKRTLPVRHWFGMASLFWVQDVAPFHLDQKMLHDRFSFKGTNSSGGYEPGLGPHPFMEWEAWVPKQYFLDVLKFAKEQQKSNGLHMVFHPVMDEFRRAHENKSLYWLPQAEIRPVPLQQLGHEIPVPHFPEGFGLNQLPMKLSELDVNYPEFPELKLGYKYDPSSPYAPGNYKSDHAEYPSESYKPPPSLWILSGLVVFGAIYWAYPH